MTQPLGTGVEQPDPLDELIGELLDAARPLCRAARGRGTLTPDEHRARVRTLRAMRALRDEAGQPVLTLRDIGAHVGLSWSRVWQLTRHATAGETTP